MSRRFALICLALLSAAFAHAESSRPADEEAIKSQLHAYAAARTIGEGHAQALFYTEDGDEWGSAAIEMTRGRAALEKTLNSPPDPKRKFGVEPQNYAFLGKDVCLVDALYSGSSGVPAGHGLYVMVRQKGQWLIRSARITRFPAPPAK